MAAIWQLVLGLMFLAARAFEPATLLSCCTLAFGVGMFVMRWWAHAETARIAAERDDCWDYANRLLESPEYYRSERGCLDDAGVPRYGLFGRIVEAQGDLWTV